MTRKLNTPDAASKQQPWAFPIVADPQSVLQEGVATNFGSAMMTGVRG